MTVYNYLQILLSKLIFMPLLWVLKSIVKNIKILEMKIQSSLDKKF